MKHLFTVILVLAIISLSGQSQQYLTGPAPQTLINKSNICRSNNILDSLSAYAVDLADYTGPNILVNFDPAATSVVDSLMDLDVEEYVGAMEQVKGETDQFYHFENTTNLYKANISNGSKVLLGEIALDQPSMFASPITGLAYDIISEEYYFVDVVGGLWLLDPVALTANYVANTGMDVPIALAFDTSGNLYSYDIGYDNFYGIDKNTGVTTTIGDIGFDALYAQGMDYDPVSKTMYMSAYNKDTEQAELRSVNLTTGNSSFLSVIVPSSSYYTSSQYSTLVFIKDANSIQVPPPFNLTATVNSNDILLNWSVEEGNYNYDGFNIYRDNVKINEALIADTFFTDMNLPPGEYNYKVTTVFNNFESEPVYTDGEILPYHMGGNLFIEGIPVDEAIAYAYQVEGLKIIDVMSYLADTLGYYSFYPVAMANYYVKVEPVFNTNTYSNYLPTYYGGALSWENASLITLDDNIYNADISLIPQSLNENGIGSIEGQIFYSDESGRDLSPAEDIQIMLRKPLDDQYGMSISNSDGYYLFKNLEDGIYEVYAEILGKESEKAQLELNSSQQTEYQINLIILDNSVVLSVDNDLPANYKQISGVYPNPVKEYSYIAVQSIKPVNLKLNLLSITGQILYQNQYFSIQNEQLKIDTKNLPGGQYHIVLEDNLGNRIVRKLTKL